MVVSIEACIKAKSSEAVILSFGTVLLKSVSLFDACELLSADHLSLDRSAVLKEKL